MRRTIIGGAILLVAGTLAVPACSNDDADASGAVEATLADFAITLSDSNLASGETTFEIENTAGQLHEFVVARTDLGGGDLPVGDDGDVAEEGATDLSVVDEVEDIEAGATGELVIADLAPGHYVVFCNLPGHYRQGMHTEITVS